MMRPSLAEWLATIEVTSWLAHPRYDPDNTTAGHDLALITLASESPVPALPPVPPVPPWCGSFFQKAAAICKGPTGAERQAGQDLAKVCVRRRQLAVDDQYSHCHTLWFER